MSPQKPGLPIDERQDLIAELRQISNRLVSVSTQVAGAYGKTKPISKNANEATASVRKLLYALDEIS